MTSRTSKPVVKSTKKTPAASKKAASPGRRFVVRRSSIHNRGVFAVTDIPKGVRLIEYLGERITHKQADRRYGRDDSAEASHTFLFIVDDKTVIDATYGGNNARWINHSCNPNCESDVIDGHVYIGTIKAIKAGQELTYDYSLTSADRHTPALKKVYACLCGARNCRGTLLAKKR